MDRKLHPELGGLVLDDEQQFVMRLRERLLRVQHAFQMKIVAVGHPSVERHLGALFGGIVGFISHVTSAFLRYSAVSQRLLITISASTSTAVRTSVSPM